MKINTTVYQTKPINESTFILIYIPTTTVPMDFFNHLDIFMKKDIFVKVFQFSVETSFSNLHEVTIQVKFFCLKPVFIFITYFIKHESDVRLKAPS